MRARLIGALVGSAIVILIVFSIPLVSFVSRVEKDRLVTALERDAFILAGHAKETLNTTEGSVLPSLQPYIEEYSQRSRARVVVTNSLGQVVAANDQTTVIGSDFSNRPEISNALEGVPAVGERNSVTLGQQLLFVAVPVLLGDQVLGVVRLSHPQSQVDKEVREQILGIVIAGLITLAASAAIAIPIALGIAGPISRLTQRTERLADGDFSVRADDTKGPPEVRELSRSFNVMAGRVGLMLENQRHFAGAVSHQLRTPLTALRLRLEQAQSALHESDSAAAEALEASRHETDRLQEMVEQLLALSRIEGATSATVTVDAVAVVKSRLEMWEPLAVEKNIEIISSLPDSAMCSVMEGALEQIIDNYIDNALGVAPAHSSLEISLTKREGRVIIDILDHGPGLKPEQLTLAFERFWRATNTENLPGTGLGLAIVRQLAVASGATVELLPRPDGLSGVVARVALVAR